MPDSSGCQPTPEQRIQRLTDLVRYSRYELFNAGLISEEEYAAIMHQGSVARLGSYDEAIAAEREKREKAEADTRRMDWLERSPRFSGKPWVVTDRIDGVWTIREGIDAAMTGEEPK
jgi:hypothetical protein